MDWPDRLQVDPVRASRSSALRRLDLDRLVTNPRELRAGRMAIPDRRGLGLTVNERALEPAQLGEQNAEEPAR